MAVRHLLIVLGDQLDLDSALFRGADPHLDLFFMAEVKEESTHVWSSKIRIAYFLSAMRHFARTLQTRGWPLVYRRLDETENTPTLAGALARMIEAYQPERLRMIQPGDYRVQQSLSAVAQSLNCPLDWLEDEHFFSRPNEFQRHSEGRKQLRLEYWYRELRIRHDILIKAGAPLGGRWNFDADNRQAFGAKGPPPHRPPRSFPPDPITREVLREVEEQFTDHPGSLLDFDWPVTAAEADLALEDFITHRLPAFGQYQDALWCGEPWLFHSRLSAAMNLKLLSPRAVVAAACDAYHQGHAPLGAVEGFVRQILGWREYVRGIYWQRMPDYLDSNALGAIHPLPKAYWTAESPLVCLREALEQTLHLGYAHHIQRLMILGLHALLLGVEPKAIHAWFLAVYVDAVEWVELPNVLGMSQYADGGIMASKPYAASGQYIRRMSNACKSCRFDPATAIGEKACPLTTLYWSFLNRHRDRWALNPRMQLPLKNLARLDQDTLTAIERTADRYRDQL